MKWLTTIFLMCGMSAQAASICVGPSSSGDGSGSDWNNKFAWSGTLVRGNIYYLEDGAYAHKAFSVALSGTTTIEVKKATTSDHVTETGWSSTMGDGAATFTPTSGNIGWNITTGYWLLDGQTGGGPSNWTNNFGFVIAATSVNTCGIVIGDGVTNATIRHTQIQGDGGDDAGGTPNNDGVIVGWVTATTTRHITLSYMHIYDMGRVPLLLHAADTTNEFVYVGAFESHASEHAEAVAIWREVTTGSSYATNTIFKNCVFSHYEGTGGIIGDVYGLQVYGCVFYRPTGQTWTSGNGMIGTWTGGNMVNCLIYDNSFVDLQGIGTFGFAQATGAASGNLSKNNIFYNCTVADDNLTHDYNHYINSGGDHSEANGTSAASGDPFGAFASLNFSLTVNTTAGADLGSPYNVDMLGNTRTTWTRGAVEFTNSAVASITTLRAWKLILR